MMAMTPYEKKTLDDIENAFFEAVELQVVKPTPTTKKPTRRGWFAGLAESMVNSFVCCAPPQTLLDDEEIHEILAQMDAPVKPAPLPRKDSLLRRNSASVMPASRALDQAPTGDVETPETGEPSAKRAHVSLVAMQRVVVTLLALHKAAETRQTERAVLAVQMKWRRRTQVAPTVTTTTAPPTPASLPAPAPVPASPSASSPPTPTDTTEPDLEPKTNDDHHAPVQVPVSSPKPRRHARRERKPRTANKKTKFAFIPAAAIQEPAAETIDALTQLALTRKRLRSVDVASCYPRPTHVNVERNVHVLFGEEEIDNDDEENDDEVAKLGMVICSPVRPLPGFALQRCASVPPPPTASRPRAFKSKSLMETQAASTLQRAWRHTKARRAREIQRRLAQYEVEKQSVMPTIRDQMTLLRKRLAEIQERNSVTGLVTVDAPVAVAPVDDDFDWL